MGILAIPAKIANRLEKKKLSSAPNSRHYTLKQPAGVLALCISLFVFSCLITVLFSFVWDAGDIFWDTLIVEMVFVCVSLFLTLYVARWKVIVEGDTIIVHSLFKKTKRIRFEEISRIKQKPDGDLVVYIGGKKAFVVDMGVIGYDAFRIHLHEIGKYKIMDSH